MLKMHQPCGVGCVPKSMPKQHKSMQITKEIPFHPVSLANYYGSTCAKYLFPLVSMLNAEKGAWCMLKTFGLKYMECTLG